MLMVACLNNQGAFRIFLFGGYSRKWSIDGNYFVMSSIRKCCLNESVPYIHITYARSLELSLIDEDFARMLKENKEREESNQTLKKSE